MIIHQTARRPRRWPWAVAGILTLIIVVVVAAVVWYQVEIRPAAGGDQAPVTFQLQHGTSLTKLAQQLKSQHLVKNATAFTAYVILTGSRHNLEAGTYELSASNSLADITATLTAGRIAKDELVVPEGDTVTQIRTIAVSKGISTATFNAALADGYTGSFLAGRPSGDSSLEGYLFPSTYQLAQPLSAHALLQDMLTTFGQEATRAGLTQAYAAEGLTLHQGVTLASIVQKEDGSPSEQPIIAQVFLKRLQLGMPLQSDVTVDYASQLTGLPFSVTLVSPYNTYLNTGLPPGPIANPGLSALEAVAHPADTDYLYFLADKNGVVHFAQTAQQHEANVQEYLDGQ
jgi:UPF0755 protein